MTHHTRRPGRKAVDELRVHAAAAVAAHSLRRVAQQVGMSAAGLQKFLDGGTPTPPIYRKLRAWRDRRAEASSGEPEEGLIATRRRTRSRPSAPDAEADGSLGDAPHVVLDFRRLDPGSDNGPGR